MQLTVRFDAAAGNDLGLGVITLAVSKEGAGYQVASVVASCALFLQGRGADFDLFGMQVQVVAAMQCTALYSECVVRLDGHVPGTERAASRGFLVLL